MVKDFARGWQGVIDLYRMQPAEDGMCTIFTGAVSSWVTYSNPVVETLLLQLRAWAALDVSAPGCKGGVVTLKFASIGLSDDGVVCCPKPYSGGTCSMNWPLPTGWQEQIAKNQTVEDFAAWMTQQTFATKGHCSSCGAGPGDTCPGIDFKWNDARCKGYSFLEEKYVPQPRKSTGSEKLSILQV